ncbi:hypothetical protein ABT272_41390 [Streptomyces sp900105245]|uniref:Uncharacterized protein n=1 Tax=Streptomyces sp. 900105245 TaxID=3154379 RepID=A0ABV1UK38_9ACTN
MAHRPFPNRERARRQVDRHHGTVPSWALARTCTDAPPPVLRLPRGEYRLSTR